MRISAKRKLAREQELRRNATYIKMTKDEKESNLYMKRLEVNLKNLYLPQLQLYETTLFNKVYKSDSLRILEKEGLCKAIQIKRLKKLTKELPAYKKREKFFIEKEDNEELKERHMKSLNMFFRNLNKKIKILVVQYTEDISKIKSEIENASEEDKKRIIVSTRNPLLLQKIMTECKSVFENNR